MEDEGRDTFWHSSAHILGQSLEMTYGCKLCIGPCTKREGAKGFYYDAYYGDVTLNGDHFDQIESSVKKAVAGIELIPSENFTSMAVLQAIGPAMEFGLVGSDREANVGSNEGIVAAGTEKERVISGEDAAPMDENDDGDGGMDEDTDEEDEGDVDGEDEGDVDGEDMDDYEGTESDDDRDMSSPVISKGGPKIKG